MVDEAPQPCRPKLAIEPPVIEWKRIGLDNYVEESRAINSPYTVEAMASLGVVFHEVRRPHRAAAALRLAICLRLAGRRFLRTCACVRARRFVAHMNRSPPARAFALALPQDVRVKTLDDFTTKALIGKHGKELALELAGIQMVKYDEQKTDIIRQLQERRAKLMKAAAQSGAVAGSKKDRAAAQKRELALARKEAVAKQKALMAKQMGRQKKEMKKMMQFERMVMQQRRKQAKKLKQQEKKDMELKAILAARVRRQAAERYAKDMARKELLEQERIQAREDSRIRFEEEEEEFRQQLAKAKREQIVRNKRDAEIKRKREEERAAIAARIEREAEERRMALEKMQKEAIARQRNLVLRKQAEAAKFKLKMEAAQERRTRAQARDREIQKSKVEAYHDKERRVAMRQAEKAVEEERKRKLREKELAEMARERAIALQRAQDNLANFIHGVIEKGEERDAYAAKMFIQKDAERKRNNLLHSLKKRAKVAAIKRQDRKYKYQIEQTIEKLELDNRRTEIVNQSKVDLIKERKATMVKVLRMKHELAAMMAKVAVTNKSMAGKKKKRKRRKKRRKAATVAPAPEGVNEYDGAFQLPAVGASAAVEEVVPATAAGE
jgi:hypothetical protein